MSGVKRYRPLHKQVMVYIRETDYFTYADSPGDMVLASDYDTLAQRCLELQLECVHGWEAYDRAAEQLEALSKRHERALISGAEVRSERDALRAEVVAYQMALTDERGRHTTAEMALRAEVELLRDAVKFASVVMGVVAENRALAEVERRSLLCEVRRCDAAMAAKEGV